MGSYFVSEYVSLRGGVDYLDSESQTESFADTTTITLPVALYYKYDETLNFGAGYRYRNSDVDKVTPQADADDHAVYIGVEDLISPLVQYALELGYQYRDFNDEDNFDSGGSAYAQGLLTWFVTDMSNIVVNISNDFGTTAANQSSETLIGGGHTQPHLRRAPQRCNRRDVQGDRL